MWCECGECGECAIFVSIRYVQNVSQSIPLWMKIYITGYFLLLYMGIRVRTDFLN